MAFFKKKDTDTTENLKKLKAVSAKVATNDFIRASKEFEKTRFADNEESKKTAWKLAYVSWLITILLALAIMGLTPLKETKPYVVRVDNNTGETDIVTMLDSTTIGQEEAVAKHLSAMYVDLMESYDWYTLQAQVDKAMIFSNDDLQQRIKTKYEQPTAPHKLYENQKRIEIKINNVAVLSDNNTMQVRFTKTLLPTDGGTWNSQEERLSPEPVVTRHIATLVYDFVNMPTVDNIRLINPFGYQVVSYRVDNEME